MRDYRQMKEIQELRKKQEEEEKSKAQDGIIEDADLKKSGEGSEAGRYSHRSPGFRGWVAYVWEYYKWPILIFGIILVGVIVGMRQMLSGANPDLSVTYVGPFYLSAENKNELFDDFARLSGDGGGDFNQDGEFKCSLLDLTITYVRDADKNVYTYDEQNGAYTRFQTELRAGDTLLYFLDKRYYAAAKSEGVLQKLEDVLDDASASFDGYGIYLGDLPCYSMTGFSRMPAGTVVCLRQSPSEDGIRYGRTVESWKAHVSVLNGMTKRKDAPAVEAGADVDLLYVAPEPAFRSYEEGVQKAASTAVPDMNGDGKRILSMRHIDISGAESDPVRRIREKEARTELVTGNSFIWLLDETTFRYAMDRGLLSPLPDELKSHKAATEGFGLLLSELPLAEASGFSDLRPDSILCLRRSPSSETESYGRSGEEYDAAAVCFVNLAKLHPVASDAEK